MTALRRETPGPKVSEKQEQAAIVELLRLIGAQVYVLGTVRPRADSHHGTCQTPGIPDVYAFLPKRSGINFGWKRPIWIEVKTRTGRASEAQMGFQAAANVSGHAYYIGTADGFASYLRDLGYVK